jgi:hypothetical protein
MKDRLALTLYRKIQKLEDLNQGRIDYLGLSPWKFCLEIQDVQNSVLEYREFGNAELFLLMLDLKLFGVYSAERPFTGSLTTTLSSHHANRQRWAERTAGIVEKAMFNHKGLWVE